LAYQRRWNRTGRASEKIQRKTSLSRRREKLFWLCAGVALIVLVFSLVPGHYEICEVAEKNKDEHCASYQIVPFVGIKIAQILDKAGGIITALATIAIAIFTFTLKRATDKLWDAGERQIEVAAKSAEAARKSADSSFAAERARFFIVLESHNLTQVIANVESRGNLASGENFSIKYRIQNYGKTPGVIKVLTLDSMIATDPVDPQSYFISIKDFPEYMIGPNGSTEPDWYSPAIAPHLSQVQAIGRNNARLWFYGRLYYDDVFGNQQVHKFYFRSVRIIGGNCILQPFEHEDNNKST
jgi:hypothetical protein